MTLTHNPAISRFERERRALRRAFAWGLHGDVRPAGPRDWLVPSRSEPGLLHRVTLTRRRGARGSEEHLACSCAAGSAGQPCQHAAAVWLWRRERAGTPVVAVH